ncbi:MAG TPA: N-formylglutamate amidohydrolase [Planctomicrobium sp.]|nr:N-formylglutamate amidohydrolase [Planctomicrobium sp.]
MSLIRSPEMIFTCEHGGNLIPAMYRHCFTDAEEVLQSHRGYDPGALELARKFRAALKAPLFSETRSRLLIELNRSLNHPRLFSQYSRTLSAEVQQQLIEQIYQPYRQQVTDAISEQAKQKRVVHVSVHSFTPVLDGKVRRTEIGLLFDPKRSFESRFCELWKKRLRQAAPALAVHFNLPYRGTSDGFTTSLRQLFPDNRYAGIELEVNQKFPLGGDGRWKEIQQLLATTLKQAIEDESSSRS